MDRAPPLFTAPQPGKHRNANGLGVVVELNRVCYACVTVCACLVTCVLEHVFTEIRLCTPICLWVCRGYSKKNAILVKELD